MRAVGKIGKIGKISKIGKIGKNGTHKRHAVRLPFYVLRLQYLRTHGTHAGSVRAIACAMLSECR